MLIVQLGEKDDCFKEISGLRFALERPKGETESICRFCHD
tara:strand:+ start:501 stop:620 length:120 start_codon:yes stop_codon:yes gene_type:complete